MASVKLVAHFVTSAMNSSLSFFVPALNRLNGTSIGFICISDLGVKSRNRPPYMAHTFCVSFCGSIIWRSSSVDRSVCVISVSLIRKLFPAPVGPIIIP